MWKARKYVAPPGMRGWQMKRNPFILAALVVVPGLPEI